MRIKENFLTQDNGGQKMSLNDFIVNIFCQVNEVFWEDNGNPDLQFIETPPAESRFMRRA